MLWHILLLQRLLFRMVAADGWTISELEAYCEEDINYFTEMCFDYRASLKGNFLVKKSYLFVFKPRLQRSHLLLRARQQLFLLQSLIRVRLRLLRHHVRIRHLRRRLLQLRRQQIFRLQIPQQIRLQWHLFRRQQNQLICRPKLLCRLQILRVCRLQILL